MGITNTGHYSLDDVTKIKSCSAYQQICSALLNLDLLWYDQLCYDRILLMKHYILSHFICLIKRFTLSSFLSNSFSDVFPPSNISFAREIFSLQSNITKVLIQIIFEVRNFDYWLSINRLVTALTPNKKKIKRLVRLFLLVKLSNILVLRSPNKHQSKKC